MATPPALLPGASCPLVEAGLAFPVAGYLLWMTVLPPPMICGLAASMSSGEP